MFKNRKFFFVKLELNEGFKLRIDKMPSRQKLGIILSINFEDIQMILDVENTTNTLLQILLGRGIHIDFSSQLKFAKIEFYDAFHL